MTEAVIGRALLRILESIIGLVDRLELGLVLLAPAMFVRVQIDREAAIGGLDRPRIRIARAAEQFVIIDLGGHAAPASFSTSPLRKRGSIFLPSHIAATAGAGFQLSRRSAARRVGKECVRKCSARGAA